jgi:hypothetical protein
VVLRLLTDDCNLALQLPDDPAQAHHARAPAYSPYRVCRRCQGHSQPRPCCSLLLPPRHSIAPACFNGIKVSTRGFKVAGAPIGDDDFCVDFTGRRVTEALAKIHAVKGIDPQVGMLLLRLCCMPMLNYLAQVTPPSLTAQHFADFDTQVADFVLQLLTLAGRASCPPPCAEDRMRLPPPPQTAYASQRSWLGRRRQHCRRCLRRLDYRRHVRRPRPPPPP